MGCAVLPLFRGIWKAPAARPVTQRPPAMVGSDRCERIRALRMRYGSRFVAAEAALPAIQRALVEEVLAGANLDARSRGKARQNTAVLRRLERAYQALVRVIARPVQQLLPVAAPPPRIAQPEPRIVQPEPLPAPAPARPLPALRIVPQQNPEGDCTKCQARPTCRKLCKPFLERARLPDPERRVFKEISVDPANRRLHAGVEMLAESAVEEAPAPRAPRSSRAAKGRMPWSELARLFRPQLDEAIETTLTSDQRRLVREVMAGKRQCDIATERGVTRPTVCIMLRRARERLRQVLVPTAFGGRVAFSC
jgi:hypothetical protein